MTNCEQFIIGYATARDTFRAADLLTAAVAEGYAETSVNWTLRKLTVEERLYRLGRGVYSLQGHQPFQEEPDESLIALAKEIIGKYPTVKVCFYRGTILTPLLHHLAYNAMTYIEVKRDFTDILFHQLQDAGKQVWHKPTREIMQNYIDISQPGIIIKPLISGSPLMAASGVPMPTLEKLLVDTFCDEDFNYLHGGEWRYMFETALDSFSINRSRLLRYASRRGKLAEIKEILNLTYYDTQTMLHKRMDRNGP